MDRIRTPDPAAEETGKIVSHRDREVTSPGLTRTQRHNYGSVRYDSGLRQFVHVPEEEIFESVCKDGIIDENPGFDGGMTIPKLNNDQTTQLDAIRNIEQEAAKRRFEPEGKSLRKKKSYNVNPENVNNEQKHQASNSPKLEEGDTCTSPRKLRRKTETPLPPILFDKKRAEMRVQSRLTRDSKVVQDIQKGGMESYRRGNDRHLNKLQCGYESPKPMPQTPLNENLRQKGTKIRKDRVRNNRQNGTE